MKYIKNLALSSVVVALLSACSGGGGDSSSTPPATAVNTISFSGVAVDGYISGATACLDLNVNGSCDVGEPATLTANNGTFSFTDIEVAKDALFAVIVTGGIDAATGKAFAGNLKNIVDSSSISSASQLSVTPLTDLVATAFMASSTKNLTTLTNAKTTVATSLGLITAKVDADPMQDKELFAKTQEIQQLKKLLFVSAAKAANITIGFDTFDWYSKEAEALSQSIANALAASLQQNATLDTAHVITLLEQSQTQLLLPANEKEFIALQMVEIKTALATLVADVTVSTTDLAQTQKTLEERVDLASTSLQEATQDSLIAVVIIDATPVVVSIPTPPSPPSL